MTEKTPLLDRWSAVMMNNYGTPQLALVRRLLGESPSDQAFGAVLGSRIASVC